MINERIDLTPFCHRARSLLTAGRPDDAIGLYDDVVRADPAFAMGYAERGTALAMTKQFARAMADLEKAFALGYDEASAYCAAGTVGLETEQFDKSMLYFNKAIERDPDYPFSYYNRANLYHTIGKQSEAITDLETLLSTDAAEDFRQLVYKRLKEIKG
jgi:tetratricopeptide (TPR) repeat protein